MKEVFVIDAVRTAIGKYGGALSNTRPDDLLAWVIKKLMERNTSIDPKAIDDVIAGAANQAGEDNRNVARMALLLAGLPVTVPGCTVNRLCASGLEAIMNAARQIRCGDAELMIAAGAESMTRAPFVMAKPVVPFQRETEIYDTTLGWRFKNKKLTDQYYPYSMGETAENVAKQWKISREKQDEFAFRSQQKYFEALEAGKWNMEIVPIEVNKVEKDFLKGTTDVPMFEQDEHPRRTSLEKLATLKPAFAKDGTVTAGNSSGINDGAASLLLASEEAVKKFALHPVARIISMGVTGVDPAIMGIGPVPATKQALQRAALNISDIDIVELNEAFASQALPDHRGMCIAPTSCRVCAFPITSR